VVTPLAVVQNWVNELKRFTPQLTHCKIQGGVNERWRILSGKEASSGSFDVYLTTYETIMSEEAFFTEQVCVTRI
jgi:SWI/SNF-related matrix-associated actin-dependent regulator of chromatin subfamily A member 5